MRNCRNCCPVGALKRGRKLECQALNRAAAFAGTKRWSLGCKYLKLRRGEFTAVEVNFVSTVSYKLFFRTKRWNVSYIQQNRRRSLDYFEIAALSLLISGIHSVGL